MMLSCVVLGIYFSQYFRTCSLLLFSRIIGTFIGLLACMLVGEYSLEVVESALTFSSFYASEVYVLS